MSTPASRIRLLKTPITNCEKKLGRATPQTDVDLIKQRLLVAQAHYQDWLHDQRKEA